MSTYLSSPDPLLSRARAERWKLSDDRGTLTTVSVGGDVPPEDLVEVVKEAGSIGFEELVDRALERSDLSEADVRVSLARYASDGMIRVDEHDLVKVETPE